MAKNVLITGVSSGLGAGLAESYLNDGYHVYGLSRRLPPERLRGDRLHHVSVDLNVSGEIPAALHRLLHSVSELEWVYLNAGVLGEIRDLVEAPLEELKHTMNVNLWANKVLIDALLRSDISIQTIIGISSGAAVNGNRGWSGYSLSKAALNMLMMLYAREQSDVRFYALAPGLIDTAMQDYMSTVPDENRFTSVRRLRSARNTDDMPHPLEAAGRIRACLGDLLRLESGSFADVRHLQG
ncbi:MAG: SDR family NAD(P)-dependent oxidoreductase [Leptospiraceae bacterium]|nr:SDR family NAD(P)-dependent oxidoreductase [Leptospiraceae bacterium]